ncbi:FMN-binding negative transcriptional regulator [Streptomyces sp. NPDC059582]|uniref:FMN-binding negative transcriptional regulator n=1 Tax=Streptomyces sp. NPDC059582 TaxID=3346875 RepID=UPI00368ACF65
MFVPPPYREPDGSWTADLIRGNPLALLVSNGTDADGPFATHLPVIPDPRASGEWAADLSGAVLLGHMNRANPHWAALGSGATAVLAFTGPHAYVSPTVYEVTPAAPTWNFTSVHVRGTIERIDEDVSAEEALQVVQSTVRAFEGLFGTGWDMSESVDYFRGILPAVGAFRFTVTGADGMFKLSQEQAPHVRDRVQQSFSRRTCSRHRATAALMEKLP